MVTLQHTFGILLLVYSVAVAIPQEGKGRSNHYEGDFGFSSDIRENSGEYVPVKFGRTIYQSSWSTEDMDSSEEKIQNAESIKTEDKGTKRWSLSNILRSALNFVNKLKGESAYTEVEKNQNKNVPKSTNKEVSEDVYLKLFKKWLRKNQILKNDDSISNYSLEHNSHRNDRNHKSYRLNPKRKSFKKFKSSRNKNRSFDEKSDRIKNSKASLNNKNDQPRALKRNYQEISAVKAFDQSSKKSSILYKTNQYDAFSDEDCNSSESFDKNKQKNSNNLIDANKKNKKNEVKKTGLAHLEVDDSSRNPSTGTDVSSSSKGDLHFKNNLEVLKKHHNSKSTGEIYPKTETTTSVSDSFHSSPKEQDTISYLQIQREASQKSVALTNFESVPNESGLNKAPTSNLNKQVVKTTKPKKSQYTLQNQNIQNPTPNGQHIISSVTEKPLEQTSKDNQTERLKTTSATIHTDHLNQYASNQSPTINSSTIRSDSESTPNENNNNSQVTERAVPLSNSAPQTTEESIPKEISTVSLGDSPSQNQKKSSRKEGSNDSQVLQTLSPATTPESSSSPKPSSEIIPKEKQDDSRNFKSTKMPSGVSSIKSQVIRTLKENSEGEEATEKVSHTTIPVSGSLPQTTEESVSKKTSNYLPGSKSISQATKDFSNSPSQLQEENTIRRTLDDLQVTEKFSPVSPVNNSLPKSANENIPKENQSDLEIISVPTIKMPESVSSSVTQGIRTRKGDSSDSQMTEKVSLSTLPVIISSPKTAGENIPEENKNYTQGISSALHVTMPIMISSSNPHDVSSVTGHLKDLQGTEKVSQPAILVISSLPQTRDETIVKEISNDLPADKNVTQTTGSSIDSQQATMPKRVSSSKPQNIKNRKGNSEVPPASMPVSNSTTQTADETIIKKTSNDLIVDKSGFQEPEPSKETMPISVSSSKPQIIRVRKGNYEIPPEAMLVSSFALQTEDETIKKESSNDLPVNKSVPETAMSLTVLSSPPQEENIPNGSISKLQAHAKNIPKVNAKTLKINKQTSSSVNSPSPQFKEKHILKENFKPKDISTNLDVTSLENVANQKSTKTKNTDRKGEFEPSNLFTKDKDSDIIFNGNHSPNKLTFVQPISKNKYSEIENYHFEELEMDSYIVSDETDQQSNKKISSSDSENIPKSTAQDVEISSLKYPGKIEQKSKVTENLSLLSTFDDELSDNEMEDQASEEETADTFLQYIYKHSNSSYFQSLRKKSDSL